MRILKSILACFVLFLNCANSSAQERYECTGGVLISSTVANTTSIFKPTFIPFAPPFLGILAKYDGNYDALGFNPRDSYVYGVEQNTQNIVRLSLYTKVDRIGKVTIVDTLNVNAGDCNSDGLYFCYDYKLGKILVFDVMNEFKLLRQISLFWDPSSSNRGVFKTRIFDFAFSPTELKTAYSYQGNSSHPDLAPGTSSGKMLKINLDFDDPNLGMVTPLISIRSNSFTHLSGLAFDSSLSLFGIGSSGDGLNPPQNTYYGINLLEGNVIKMIEHNVAPPISDACSCPFPFQFYSSAPTNGIFCNNDTRDFPISIRNNSLNTIKGALLKDTFPPGTIITSLSNEFLGKVDSGTGIGTNILSISDLTIPALTKVTIEIKLTTVNAMDGEAFNQAYLYNLPSNYPPEFKSDNPASSTPNDRTNFYFITKKIEKISWKIKQPTNCFPANDGKLWVTSPEFLKGKSYEVSLRNKKGWDEQFSIVTIDDNNTFSIDSLIPGDYQMFRFRILDSECAVSLKDTTFIIEAPHELINLKLTSNNLVCEGDTIKLSSTRDLTGYLSWNGPSFFGSADQNTFIEGAGPQNKGRYDLEARSGFCEQKKSIDVVVKSKFNSVIVGDTIYCLRDTLILRSEGNVEGLKFSWKGPNNLSKTDSLLKLPLKDYIQSGYYEAIGTNGACYDTNTVNITVLPTPTLALDQSILTDYCEPVILSTKVFGTSEVTYNWLPKEGLSCSDCANPQIQPIVQSIYNLTIENDFGCKDSSSIKIALDKDKIAFTPNIFSPYASSANQQFQITPNCVVRYIKSLVIYDRSGNKIYNSSAASAADPIAAWDGQSAGKSASPGVYIWIAKVELIDGSVVQLKGDITLL